MLHHFKLTDGLLWRYANLACNTVIPFQEAVLHDQVEEVAHSHAIANFRNAALLNQTGEKKESVHFFGMVFQDSDVAKWLEAAAYSLLIKPDTELETRIDKICDLIAGAQEEDGYLNTYYTLDHPERKFTNLLEGHELYCAGHMMEAAVALYEVTGNRKLLDVMQKNADCLYRHFITEGTEGYPGHPEVELALMRLWRVSGNDNYRELAEHFINVRGVDSDFYIRERDKRDWQIWGNDPTNKTYQQSHLPVREQSDAVGHSVRAGYLYSAMADLAAVTKEPELTEACMKLFDSITKRQMYITGGIGSTHIGEAFTTDFDLPNDTCYAESCASVSLIFFAFRMLKLKRDGRYADVMERALYNIVLAGIGLDGKKFFYGNPHEVIPGVSGQIPTHGHIPLQRHGWFACACCPPNIARMLTSIARYAWEHENGILYSNLYVSGTLSLAETTIHVETDYPFGNTVKYTVKSGQTRLAIHIPEFTRKKYTVSMPGEYKDGYYYLNVYAGDTVEINLDMTPKLNRSSIMVAGNSGLGAVTVGPVVYCAEGTDNDGDVFSLSIDGSKLHLNCEHPDEIGGFSKDAADLGTVYTVRAEGCRLVPEDPEALYFTDTYQYKNCTLKLIPYFMWGNRGVNQMRIWIPIQNCSH